MFLFGKKEYIKSNTKLQDLLPVGSIIQLKNKTDKYIIMDYRGYEKDKNLKNTYNQVDYRCARYPLGYGDIDENAISVQNDDISNVIFKGYTDNDRIDFLTNVQKEDEAL